MDEKNQQLPINFELYQLMVQTWRYSITKTLNFLSFSIVTSSWSMLLDTPRQLSLHEPIYQAVCPKLSNNGDLGWAKAQNRTLKLRKLLPIPRIIPTYFLVSRWVCSPVRILHRFFFLIPERWWKSCCLLVLLNNFSSKAIHCWVSDRLLAWGTSRLNF